MSGPFSESTASDPSWPTTRPQVGPVATGGPGTLGSIRQQAGDAWNASGQSGAWNAAKFGYSFGRDAAQAQGQAQPAAAEDSGYANGDGGSEMATAEDVAALHEHIDQVHQTVNGLAGQQSAGLQHLTPQSPGGGSALPARPPQVDPLAQSAQARANANASAQQSAQHLQAGQQRNLATFQSRQQASAAGMNTPTTANGMSAGFAATSFFGRQGSGVGSSAATWESARWKGQ